MITKNFYVSGINTLLPTHYNAHHASLLVIIPGSVMVMTRSMGYRFATFARRWVTTVRTALDCCAHLKMDTHGAAFVLATVISTAIATSTAHGVMSVVAFTGCT